MDLALSLGLSLADFSYCWNLGGRNGNPAGRYGANRGIRKKSKRWGVGAGKTDAEEEPDPTHRERQTQIT